MSDPIWTRAKVGPAPPRGVSFVFIGLLVAFAAVTLLLGLERGGTIGVFVFAFLGWIISLCLHEWGHAATAWIGGDRSVAEMGYLTLNPLRYAHPFMSLVVPLAFLAMGGIGFPGGAVYINTHALRGPVWRAAVSAAGPAMNLLFLVFLALAIHISGANGTLLAGLAFLAFLQATALILNLLPLPGLDGFGIVQSLFPESERAAMAQIASWLSLVVFVVIISAPELLRPVWQVAEILCNGVGVDSNDIANGIALFRFWDSN